MKYDFEHVTKRYDMGVPKYEAIPQYDPAYKQMDIIPFSVADMEFETAPEIREGLKRYLDRYSLGYVAAPEAYLNAVCSWMKRRHRWEIRPEWILGTHGVQDAFYNAVKLYTAPGDGVLLMTPYYSPMYDAIAVNGREVVENPLRYTDGRYEIDFEDLEEKAKQPHVRMMLLCSPHNPSGRVFTREELTRIGQICLANHVLVCADEIHEDFVSPGHTFIPYASICEELAQHALICTSPSKTFSLPGLQTANLIIPNEALRDIFARFQKTVSHYPKLPSLGYEACRLAYEESELWLDQCRTVIERNRQMVVAFFAEYEPSIRVVPLEGTYLLWIDFRALGIPAKELADRLKRDAQLFFSDGDSFGPGGAGFERWNLACPTRYVQEGLERLKAALEKWRSEENAVRSGPVS